MIEALFPTLISVVIVSLISLIGVFVLAFKTKNLHKILLLLVGFAVGALLGDVFIHLLPEIIEDRGFTLATSFSVLAGIIVFFVLEKFVQWHHCHLDIKCKEHPLATMNLIGDALHNFIDGTIIAASYLAGMPIGIATTVAVILHEIPQEIGDFAVLLHAGMSKARALWFNFLSALTAILGALIVLIFSKGSLNGLSFIIPFTAGGFIYIAGSDLLPELHKREYTFKSALLQLISILLGIAVMYALVLLE